MNVPHDTVKEGAQFSRKDGCIALLIFVAAVALRIPFRSHLAYHWDSAQFALAIKQYDLRLSQPHAPGYFLYVMLGRLVNFFLDDPHQSLVWISILFGGALPALVFLLGTAMFGRVAGLAAGLFAVTSPQVWFHSCVALTYVVEAFLVGVLVLALWQAMWRGGTWPDALAIGALWAVIGGVRQQTAPALAPLVLWVFYRFRRQRMAKFALAVAVAIGLSTLWFVPMVRMSGGLGTYWEIVRLHTRFNASATFWGHGTDAVVRNVINVAGACGNGLGLAAVVLVAGLIYRVFGMAEAEKAAWNLRHERGLEILVAWIAPMLALGTVIGFTKQPGYVLSYLSGWFILAGAALSGLKGRGKRITLTLAVCLANIMMFIGWPMPWDGVFFGMGRSAQQIAEHDAQLSRIINVIRLTYQPDEIVICHAKEFYLYGLRPFQLYLPGYEQYQFVVDQTTLHPPGDAMWLVRDGHLEFASKLDLGHEKKGIVLVVPPGEKVDIFAPYLSLANVEVLANSEDNLYFLPADDARRTLTRISN